MKKTIAFITDTHLDEPLWVEVDQKANWKKVLADLENRQIDEIVIGGDISDASYYGQFFADLSAYEGRYRVIPGNHDTVPALLQHFPNPENPDLAELYYGFTDDNFLYLFLDSSSGEISAPQLHWLQAKLDANHLKILLFIHHPIFEVDSYVDRKYPLRNRDAVRELLENQECEVFIFCGHYHCEDETGSGAISQFDTPAVSYQVEKGTDEIQSHAAYFGYRIIALENANVRNELIILKP